MKWIEKIGVAVVVALLAWFSSRNFVAWTATSTVLTMNDVGGIMTGFHQTPNLWSDGLRWWHGAWIEDGISVLRPLSSYLLWIESWIGLRFGFLWVAWFGYLLFVADCLLCSVLAWRFTRSKIGALLGGALSTQILIWNWSGTTPDYWLAWYPVHHDLLMIGFLLAALLFFDLWLETAVRKHLIACWACFLAGALCKEFVYIFPAMAFVMALLRAEKRMRRAALWQIVGLVFVTILLVVYRSHVLVHPYNPRPLKRVHFIKRPFLYWFPSFYKWVLSDDRWFAGLSVVIFALIAGVRALRHHFGSLLQKPLAKFAVVLGVALLLGVYCTIFYGSWAEALWFLFDYTVLQTRISELAQMVFALWVLHLLWKYRCDEPTLCCAALTGLSYAPVWTYLGWHYTLCGWFFRCAFYWPLVAKLVWLEVGEDKKVRLLSGVLLPGRAALR